MATHTGSAGTVKVGSNAIAELKSWTLDQSSGTMDCFWDETDSNGQVALAIGTTATLNLYPEGATSGDTFYSGSAIITSVGVSQSHDGIVERSFGFQITGAVTIATV